jgi:hypothetical protein
LLFLKPSLCVQADPEDLALQKASRGCNANPLLAHYGFIEKKFLLATGFTPDELYVMSTEV